MKTKTSILALIIIYTYRAVCIERRANNNKPTNNSIIPYNMKKVKAIFRGQDGSCGFQTGREYTLLIHHSAGTLVRIEDESGSHRCDYSNMMTFLDNWDNIRRA